MSLAARAAKYLLSDIRHFSRIVIGLELREYQQRPARAILDSILNNRGLEFLLVFPRQSGKDELVAQLQVYLLNLFQRREASIVHVYPSKQQIPIGTGRVENRLRNSWNDGRWWSKTKPDRRGLGLAQISFFSGHPQSKAEGATANLALIVNETQDQIEFVIERRYVMMAASTNATRIFIGTVRTTSDYLWQKKRELERLQSLDGVQRVFFVTPDEVGEENPNYAAFVAAQVAAKGRHHPVVKTELFLEPIDAQGGLFDERRRALLVGSHPRQRKPNPDAVYAAVIDVAGQDEAATEAFAELSNPKRDATTCIIIEVIPTDDLPKYRAVDIFVDVGSRHFESFPGRPALSERLNAYLDHWDVRHVVCDESGVGAGLTSWLRARRGADRVTGYNFAGAGKKAKLGSDFISLIETGRIKYFDDGGEVGSEIWWLLKQAAACQYHLPEGGAIETHLRWSVPERATVEMPDGSTEVIHDDRLLALALTSVLDDVFSPGRAESEIIPAFDPLSREGW